MFGFSKQLSVHLPLSAIRHFAEFVIKVTDGPVWAGDIIRVETRGDDFQFVISKVDWRPKVSPKRAKRKTTSKK